MASLRDALAGLQPVNLGAVADVERWRPHERSAMLREAEALTRLAVDVGASYVQLLTGPVQPGGRYTGPGELSAPDRERVTAEALRAVADLGAPYGIRYDLEPLAWTPLAPLDRAIAAIAAAERDNVGIVLDFWHLWQVGTTPEDLARLDPLIIFGVDFSDSLGPPGADTSAQRSRRVWPGEGEIPFGNGPTRSARPVSTAGGTTSCTARHTGSRTIRSASRPDCSTSSGTPFRHDRDRLLPEPGGFVRPEQVED